MQEAPLTEYGVVTEDELWQNLKYFLERIIPVAEEAAITAEALGRPVTRVYDVGVAGIHRLLAQRRLYSKAVAVVVCAGMEGALASVVGGLVACPVIAVPTSVGYGAHLKGLAPLLTMLTEELLRNVQELGKHPASAPYFLAYEAIDEHSVSIEASFGNLVSSSNDRSRSLDVDVRVGTPKLDIKRMIL